MMSLLLPLPWFDHPTRYHRSAHSPCAPWRNWVPLSAISCKGRAGAFPLLSRARSAYPFPWPSIHGPCASGKGGVEGESSRPRRHEHQQAAHEGQILHEVLHLVLHLLALVHPEVMEDKGRGDQEHDQRQRTEAGLNAEQD